MTILGPTDKWPTVMVKNPATGVPAWLPRCITELVAMGQCEWKRKHSPHEKVTHLALGPEAFQAFRTLTKQHAVMYGARPMNLEGDGYELMGLKIIETREEGIELRTVPLASPFLFR